VNRNGERDREDLLAGAGDPCVPTRIRREPRYANSPALSRDAYQCAVQPETEPNVREPVSKLVRAKRSYDNGYRLWFDSTRSLNSFILASSFVGLSFFGPGQIQDRSTVSEWAILSGAIAFALSLFSFLLGSAAERPCSDVLSQISEWFRIAASCAPGGITSSVEDWVGKHLDDDLPQDLPGKRTIERQRYVVQAVGLVPQCLPCSFPLLCVCFCSFD
jgi:hypothetical protein